MSDEAEKHSGCFGCAGLVAAFVAGAGLGGLVSTALTSIALDGAHYHKQYEFERDAVAPTIAKDPAFKDVHVSEYSGGGVYISGDVPTGADEKRLKELIIRGLGERRAETVLGVGVRDKQK